MASSYLRQNPDGAMRIRDQRIPGWYWSHNQFMDQYAAKLGVFAVSVYHLLCRHARDNRVRGWSVSRMACALGCGRTKLSAELCRLEEQNVIARLQRAGAEIEYVLLDLTGTSPASDVGSGSDDPSASRVGVVRETNIGCSLGEHPIRKENLQDRNTKTPPYPLFVPEHAQELSRVAQAVMIELGFSGGRLQACLAAQARIAIEQEGKTGNETISDMVGLWRRYTSSTEYKRVSMGALSFFSEGKWRVGRDDPKAWCQINDEQELMNARTKRNIAAVRQAEQLFLEREAQSLDCIPDRDDG